MKDTSEPTGSPAPVIQHSSLAPSPSSGQNGLSSRAAAEAMAVLAGMGQQQRAESGPSHIIMAAQSQSAARWWAMPLSLELAQPGVKKNSGLSLSSLGTLMANLPHFPLAVLLCSLWDSGRAIVLWPGAQQQPSENGLRHLRELPVHFAIDYRGWTPISHPAFSLHFHSQLPSQSDWLLAGLQDCITTSALLTWTPLRTTIVNFWSSYQTADGAFHCFQQGIVPCVCQRLSHTQ